MTNMTPVRLIEPASLHFYHDPFPYFIAMTALDQEFMSSLLTWLEAEASWELVEEVFYEQHELRWSEGKDSTPVSLLTNSVFLDAMRKEVGALFHRTFTPRVDWSVHKLLTGQRIRIHNDLLMNGESHRVILHLNRGWSISQGGFLLLFDSANPGDVNRVLMPLTGSVVGFEISEEANHAVSLVLGGERFAIVYSLYADNRY